jgi:type III restriction enzyme
VDSLFSEDGFKNADLALSDATLLANIHDVQRAQNLPVSDALVKTKVARVNLDIEMETGTGKTYCYIKTIFELNKQLRLEQVHHRRAQHRHPRRRGQVAGDHGRALPGDLPEEGALLHLQLQAAAPPGELLVGRGHQRDGDQRAGLRRTGQADNRRIYDVLDDFQSRRPIDVISANRPILILDEPQKMEGGKTLKSLEEFKAADGAALLGHPQDHAQQDSPAGRAGRLQPEAGEEDRGARHRREGAGGHQCLPVPAIHRDFEQEAARGARRVRAEAGGRQHQARGAQAGKGDNLFRPFNGLDQYRGFVVSDINANTDTLSFTNGVELFVGDAAGDVNEAALRRIQIREAIKAHFDKEQALFQQGVKVLTLFFIDEVAKYRDYARPTRKGEYARIFEEEYRPVPERGAGPGRDAVHQVPERHSGGKTHSGYFSIDKKTKRLVDPDVAATRRERGLSTTWMPTT